MSVLPAAIGLGLAAGIALPLINIELLESESGAKEMVAEFPKINPLGKVAGTVAVLEVTVDPTPMPLMVGNTSVPVVLV